ncbi:MAG: DUF2199 domain-containing protein, partial [Isosphaeraceae bacterium]
MRFQCLACKKEHDLAQVSFAAAAPLQWGLLSDEERERSSLSQEQCEIDSREGRSYYVKACLDIPIRGTARTFTWGVWCSLSETSFTQISAHWGDPDRARLGPYFGWLCTQIPGYPSTAFLKTRVHQRPVGLRPAVELEPTDHPLAVDQRLGIETHRLISIVTELIHQND